MKKSALLYIFLSGLASALNFAIYPILSRVLPEGDFVEVTVALALFTQLSSFMLSMVALTIGLSKIDPSQAKVLSEKLQAILSHLFFIIVSIFLLISPLIIQKMQLSASMLIPICAMLLLSINMSIITGYLNGAQKLVKLGIATAFSAVVQLALSAVVGQMTKNGVAALNAMAFASFGAIVIIYYVYRSDSLPNPKTIFDHGIEIYKSKKMRALVKYTVVAAASTLLLNIFMIADLLLINRTEIDSTYTDIYVVSRIVFFSGMLFIWPFLSVINLKEKDKNTKPFLKLTSIIFAISLTAVLVMHFIGKHVLKVILGGDYANETNLKILSTLSIIYKFMFLIITSLSLYFIVMRSYWVVWLSLSFIVPLIILINSLHLDTSPIIIVSRLILVSFIALITGIIGYLVINSDAANSKDALVKARR